MKFKKTRKSSEKSEHKLYKYLGRQMENEVMKTITIKTFHPETGELISEKLFTVPEASRLQVEPSDTHEKLCGCGGSLPLLNTGANWRKP